MACRHFKRSAVSVACKRAVYNSGIYGLEILIAKAQLIHNAGTELLKDNIIFFYKLFNDCLSFLGLKIKEHSLFVSSKPSLACGYSRIADKGRIVENDVRLARRAYLKHLSAHIGQHKSGIGAGKQS